MPLRVSTLALRVAPALVPVAVFAPALIASRFLTPGDGVHYSLPLQMMAAQSWRAGHVPVWTPFEFSGAPLLAMGQAGAFYPPNALFLATTFWAPNLLLLLHFALAGLGAAALARRLCGDEVGAAVAGIGFALCGFLFAHVGHPGVEAAAAWLPWMLLALERLRERFSPWRLAQGAAVLALGALTGHLQTLAVSVAMLAIYAGTLALLERGRAGARTALFAAAMVATGLGLAAVQMLPTMSVLGETNRGSLSFASATSYSLSWSHAPLLLFPYLFGSTSAHAPFTSYYRGDWNLAELTAYPGMALLVLAIAGAGVRRDRRSIALVACAAVALIGMLGASTPAGRLIHALPIYGQFRAWGRYALVLDLAIAVLAGYGVAALRSASFRLRRAAARRAAVAAAAILAAALLLPRLDDVDRLVAPGLSGTLAIAIPATAALAAAGCCVLALRRLAPALAVLLLLVIADPIASFGGSSEWRASPSIARVKRLYSSPRPPALRTLNEQTPGVDRFLIYPTAMRVLVNSAQGVRSVNGRDVLAPSEYLEALGQSDRRLRALGLSDVVVASPQLIVGPRSHVADLLQISLVVGRGGKRSAVRPRRIVLPDAFVVGRVQQRARRDILAAIWGRRPFDPGRTALVERCGRWCRAIRREGRAGRVRGVDWELDSVALDVHARRPGLLNVSQAWFPGWKAEVDGRDAPVVRSNALVTAVPVPAGNHHVVLRYRAPGFRAGVAASLLTALGLIAWGSWGPRSGTRR